MRDPELRLEVVEVDRDQATSVRISAVEDDPSDADADAPADGAGVTPPSSP